MKLKIPAEIDGISEAVNKFERSVSGRIIVIGTMRPFSAPMGGEHLVSTIALKGRSRHLWFFQPARMKKTLARLREDRDNNLYIVMDSFGINEVIPISSLVSGKKPAIAELLDLKTRVAWAMNSLPRYTEEEKGIFQAREAAEREKRAAAMRVSTEKRKAEEELAEKKKAKVAAEARAERQAKEAEIVSKKAKRLSKRLEIMSREAVTVCTSLGCRFTGKPVTGDEWKVLEDGSRVVSVDSHGKTGQPLEAFTVEKKGGGECRKTKILTNLRLVGDQTRMKAESNNGSPLDSRSAVLVEIRSELFELPHYASLKEFKVSRENRTLIAIGNETKDSKIVVFKISGETCNLMGSFPAIKEAEIVN